MLEPISRGAGKQVPEGLSEQLPEHRPCTSSLNSQEVTMQLIIFTQGAVAQNWAAGWNEAEFHSDICQTDLPSITPPEKPFQTLPDK